MIYVRSEENFIVVLTRKMFYEFYEFFQIHRLKVDLLIPLKFNDTVLMLKVN